MKLVDGVFNFRLIKYFKELNDSRFKLVAQTFTNSIITIRKLKLTKLIKVTYLNANNVLRGFFFKQSRFIFSSRSCNLKNFMHFCY